jgi:hypothetical protein
MKLSKLPSIIKNYDSNFDSSNEFVKNERTTCQRLPRKTIIQHVEELKEQIRILDKESIQVTSMGSYSFEDDRSTSSSCKSRKSLKLLPLNFDTTQCSTVVSEDQDDLTARINPLSKSVYLNSTSTTEDLYEQELSSKSFRSHKNLKNRQLIPLNSAIGTKISNPSETKQDTKNNKKKPTNKKNQETRQVNQHRTSSLDISSVVNEIDEDEEIDIFSVLDDEEGEHRRYSNNNDFDLSFIEEQTFFAPRLLSTVHSAETVTESYYPVICPAGTTTTTTTAAKFPHSVEQQSPQFEEDSIAHTCSSASSCTYYNNHNNGYYQEIPSTKSMLFSSSTSFSISEKISTPISITSITSMSSPVQKTNQVSKNIQKKHKQSKEQYEENKEQEHSLLHSYYYTPANEDRKFVDKSSMKHDIEDVDDIANEIQEEQEEITYDDQTIILLNDNHETTFLPQQEEHFLTDLLRFSPRKYSYHHQRLRDAQLHEFCHSDHDLSNITTTTINSNHDNENYEEEEEEENKYDDHDDNNYEFGEEEVTYL